MTLTKPEMHAFTRKLYQFLKGGHRMEFKKMRTLRGWIDTHDETYEAHVVLDHRDRLVSTLIHEFIHWQYPDYSETKVLEMERAVMHRLTDRQIRNIIKRFADVL